MNDTALMDPPSAAEVVYFKVSTGLESASQRGDRNGVEHDWLERLMGSVTRWRADAEGLAADDLEPPTDLAVETARGIAGRMQQRGAPAPSRIVLDTDGGLSFELEVGDTFQSIEVHPDGSAELLEFRRGRLTSREPIPRSVW